MNTQAVQPEAADSVIASETIGAYRVEQRRNSRRQRSYYVVFARGDDPFRPTEALSKIEADIRFRKICGQARSINATA